MDPEGTGAVLPLLTVPTVFTNHVTRTVASHLDFSRAMFSAPNVAMYKVGEALVGTYV